jgi:hypothetical protein
MEIELRGQFSLEWRPFSPGPILQENMHGDAFFGVAEMKAVLLVLFLLSLTGSATEASAAPAGTESPQRVEVVVWFNGIHTIDFLDGSFGAEFYVWWISRDPDFRPFEVFQVLNGRQWTTRAVNRRVLADGSYYTSGFVSVTVSHHWDLLYYPFDRQRLQIMIETPFPASAVRLVPNQRDSVVSEFVDVGGFRITGFKLAERVEEYQTSFGLEDDTGKHFSRLVIEIGLQRESGRIVVAILIGFIVANLIALFTYLIHVSMLGIRATMVASAIFGAVGNMYFLNSQVSPAAGSLLVDRFALGTFSAILIALLNGIIVDRLVQWHKPALARRVNWTVFSLVVFGSAIFYSLAFHAAIRGSA